MNATNFQRKRAKIERAGYREAHWQRRAMAALVREARALLVEANGKLIAYKLPSGETVCIKQRFKNEAVAVTVLEQISAEPFQRPNKPIRAYPCFACQGWHITSQQK